LYTAIPASSEPPETALLLVGVFIVAALGKVIAAPDAP
jgi:hypothetical protein